MPVSPIINITSDIQQTSSPGGITSSTVTAPAGTDAGDILVLVAYAEDFGSTPTATPPAGFTTAGVSYRSHTGIWIFTKTLSATASGSFQVDYGTATYYAVLKCIALDGTMVEPEPFVFFSEGNFVLGPPIGNYVAPGSSYFLALNAVHRTSANPEALYYPALQPPLWDDQVEDAYSGSSSYQTHAQILGAEWNLLDHPTSGNAGQGSTVGPDSTGQTYVSLWFNPSGGGGGGGTIFLMGDEKIWARGMARGMARGYA